MMRPNTPPFTTEGLLEEIRSWVLIESPTDNGFGGGQPDGRQGRRRRHGQPVREVDPHSGHAGLSATICS